MITQTLTASTGPTDHFRAPLSGEGSLAVTASTIADGIKLQASARPEGDWYDLPDVVVDTSGGTVNFKTDFPYLRVSAVTGAVTAEEILISGQE